MDATTAALYARMDDVKARFAVLQATADALTATQPRSEPQTWRERRGFRRWWNKATKTKADMDAAIEEMRQIVVELDAAIEAAV